MSTALIPPSPAETAVRARYAGARPRAEFLTQLIATRTQAPQTRLRGRAEPEEAVAAYAVNNRSPKPTGRTLSRSL